jgi:nucleoid DNA-binding protein
MTYTKNVCHIPSCLVGAIMTQFDLIMVLASKEDLTEENAVSVINLMFDGFMDEMKNGRRNEI